jgi:hypothetical protein
VPTTPASGDWTVVARPVEASGVQQPGLIVTGPAVNENIGTVLVEYSTSGSGPWVQAYSGPPTIASVEINGLIGGTAYYVGITYWSVRGVPSAQLVKGPYTAPGLTSGDVVPITPGDVAGTPSLSISTTIVADGSQVSRLSGSWTPPANALTYVVEIDNGAVTTQFAAPEASIADRIVTTGATYRYRVKALSRTGTLSTAWSSYSASVAAGGDTTPPGVITSPSITGQLGTIAVAWTNPTDDDLSHVKIYRHTANVSGSSTFVGSVLSDNATLYVPLALTTYYFWAATVDRSGNEGAKTALGSAQALAVGDLAELDTVGTSRIDAGAVTTSRLATDAVTANEIAAGAVGSTELAAGSVTTSRLATDAVTANEIAAGAVGSTELAAGAVTTSRLATDAVTANEIAAGAVAATELATGAVTTAKIAALAVTSAELAAAAVTTAKIAASAVTAAELATGAVTTAKIAASAITATELAAGAVTAAKLDTGAVTTLKVTAGAITPVYAALTTGTVNWTASAAEKDLQTVASVVVTRGKVIIRASFTCDLSPQGSASVVGILRLYRGGSEIFDAQTTQTPVATLASSSNYVFSKQWVLDFIDDPGAGTYTYKITFDPGHTADGDLRRRFLSVTPMEG